MNAPQPKELLRLATEVGAEAAAMILQRLGTHRSLTTKSSELDLVTEVDIAAEHLITERLLAARPDDGIIGEEGTGVATSSGVDWIIDPIDGTTSFVYGLPGFSVSIAARFDGGGLMAGCVHAPVIGSVYAAALGEGATWQGRPAHCSEAPSLKKALVGTGFSPDNERRQRQGQVFAQLIPQVRDIRRMGSAALDLGAVAAGQLDAYFEVGLCEWDYAAGQLLVTEAGGQVVAELDPATGRAFVAAAAPGISDEFFAMLRDLEADRL